MAVSKFTKKIKGRIEEANNRTFRAEIEPERKNISSLTQISFWEKERITKSEL